MADIEIEIDGQKLTAKPNQTVIQVADSAGIYIPRFCYHKHLSVAANCRMCLVEVEKSPKTLPACATPVTPGMKVFTKSPKSLEAQRAVMEFLLINHPLDCPICDQGGECELQDLAMGYGSAHSQYTECKRSVADENLGPLISTDMTRCILCTRCVRFGAEIAGMRELGVTFRGEHEEISTVVEQSMTSEVSGNIIDLCPVGALTSKPFRFKARAWELNQASSISPHDCLNSNLNVHTRYGRVMRVVPRENKAINETWISDRDRFSYTGLYHPERLEEPMARINGQWQAVDWQTAFEIASGLLHDIIAEHGADKLGALVSPNATLEEYYLLQKIVRGLGSAHIDHRLREIDTHDQAEMGAFPGLNMSLTDLEEADAILLIGSNIQKEQPLAGLRVRKASLKGADVLAVNPVDYPFNFKVTAKEVVAPHRLLDTLNSIIQSLQANTPSSIAMHLQGKQKLCIVLGSLSMHHHQASAIRYAAQQIAILTGGRLGFMTDGGNSAGAWLAGAIPHRHAGGIAINHCGLSAYEMLEKPRKAYLLLNVDPEFDCASAHHAVLAIKQAQCVIAFSMYRNPILEAHAGVIFPIAAFTETSGTFVNAMGEWQSFTGVAQAFGSSRPAWKVLRVLGNFLHLEGFEYESSEAIKHEVKALVEKMPPMTQKFSPKTETATNTMTRVGEVPLYVVDSLVRRAEPLQAIQSKMEGELASIRLHPKTAENLKAKAGDQLMVKQPHTPAISLPLVIDARVAIDAAWIAGGIAATTELGDLFGEVEVTKC